MKNASNFRSLSVNLNANCKCKFDGPTNSNRKSNRNRNLNRNRNATAAHLEVSLVAPAIASAGGLHDCSRSALGSHGNAIEFSISHMRAQFIVVQQKHLETTTKSDQKVDNSLNVRCSLANVCLHLFLFSVFILHTFWLRGAARY